MYANVGPVLQVSSQEQEAGMLNNMSPSSGGMVYSQAQYQYSSPGMPPMTRPPSVTPVETPNMTVNPHSLGPMSGMIHHPGAQGNPRFGHQMLRQKMLSQQQHQQMQQQGYNMLQQNMHLVSVPHNMGQNIKPYPGAVQPPPKVKPSPQIRNGQSSLSQPNSPANNAMSPHVKTSPGVKTSASPSNLVGSPKMNASSNQKLQPDMNNSSPVMSSPQISQPSNHMSHPSNHISHPSNHMSLPGGQMPMPSEQLSHPTTQLSHQNPQISHPSSQLPHQSPQMSHPSVQMSHPSNQIPHPTNQMSHPNVQMSHPQMSHPGSLQHLQGGDGRLMGMRPHLGHHPGLPPNHMMGGMMGQHPPMYMNMISQPHPRPAPPPTNNNRSTSTQKGKNNVSVICPICNKVSYFHETFQS